MRLGSLIFLVVGSLPAKTLYVDQNSKMVRAQESFCAKHFNSFMRDFIDVNREVFASTDTLKILTWVFPTYLIARFSDDAIHSSFYDAGLHKNVSQCSDTFYKFTSAGTTALTIALLVSPLFKWINADVRRTSVMMNRGLLSIFIIRSISKYSFKGRSCLRPWHQSFSCTQRAVGGFPSGHMAMAGYLTMLYGLEFGPSWGFPLSVFSALAFFASLNHNRHYASQLVAGLGLGVVYGYAAHKMLDYRYNEQFSVNLDFDTKLRPTVNLAYEF